MTAEPAEKILVDVNDMEREGKKSRLLKTGLINASFLAMGLCDGVRGPTLLDLTDVYESTVEAISFTFMLSSIGALLGSFLSGYLMNRFPLRSHLFMFSQCLSLGLLTLLCPIVGHVNALFVLCFFIGVTGAGICTGGNVLCLQIWRGLKGGPFMNSIHFTYGVGAFLAPLISTPFLSVKANVVSQLEADGADDTAIEDVKADLDDESKVAQLFPLVGSVPILISLVFLYCDVRDRKENKITQVSDDVIVASERQKWSGPVIILLTVMALLYTCYCGTEHTLGVLLTTFSVQMQLTKAQGNTLAAIYYGAFSTMRFLSIFVAMRLTPIVVISCCLVTSVAGSLAFVVVAQLMPPSSMLVLMQVCVGVLGVGMAAVYATGQLWLERSIVITSKVGALITFASCLGVTVFPVIVGQYITTSPLVFVYTIAASLAACLLLFILAWYLAKVVNASKSQVENGKL